MKIFNADQQDRIVHAINVAENTTSGELRVVVEKNCDGEAIDRASYHFTKLGMHKTAQRNGVLIYIAVEDHTFSIIGDLGINKLVPADFWECTKEAMVTEFRQGNLVEGLVKGIVHAGEQLRHFFPRQQDDINELPNDIVFGDK
ncbi:TPM domain-containing protein [Sphingobacteriaceae bacterium WQ 2009]|uniref:TPM domain-containing protein n=1 Tax=Rhinopithecimicrobium faecis TaxID=2820698 RepID=A0A8T4H961_9SPHI|nr:TPM domain-containing protein [Sphingobacteriaceae bacterium WQ 2009]